MFERISTHRAKMTVSLAGKRAHEKGRKEMLPEDLLEGLFDTHDINSGVGLAAIRMTGNDINQIKSILGYSPVSKDDLEVFNAAGYKIPLSKESKKLLELAIEEARAINHNYLGTEHFALSILKSRYVGEERIRLLEEKGITYDSVLDNIQILLGNKEDPNRIRLYESIDNLMQSRDFGGANNKLQSLGVSSLLTDEIFDCLLATHGRATELSYRSAFYQTAQEEIKRRGEYQGRNVKLLDLLR
ncbi:MAG TPA: Clp protease N-terminal domain-containing protein [Candidatus Nanoarchaeia archaeon]|nr:Clp protease N-terminal domain-containing protein [Candidatus Nanoarchaeia archaeon]